MWLPLTCLCENRLVPYLPENGLSTLYYALRRSLSQVLVGVLPWQSMSLISATIQRTQTEVLGQLVNCSSTSEKLGCVVMPLHCYKKGGLWRLEAKAMENLANVNLNIDRSCTIPLLGKADDRDGRPLSYPAVFACLCPMRRSDSLPDMRVGSGHNLRSGSAAAARLPTCQQHIRDAAH